MIWYVLATGIIIYCFEIIGRCILSFLKIGKFKCCFGIGLIVFLAYSYVTTSLITSLNGSFYVVSVIYGLFFIIFFMLIVRDRKKISFKIDLVNLLVLCIFVTIMLLYAYNTTLGFLNGFDCTFYLNIVTKNIKSCTMNYSFWNSSIDRTYISKAYSFQSYYYIASFISYMFSSIINIFHRTYYQTTYIWVFQILFNAFFYSLIVNSIELMRNRKNRVISLLIIVFFLLVYGRIYYYNVLGFFGNTYRVVTVGYSTMLLYLLLNSNKSSNLMTLFIASLLASASVSSSSLFIDVFILFAAYFVLCDKYEDILKYYSIALLFILTNLLSASLQFSVFYSFLVSLVISATLFLVGNRINSFLSRKKVLIFLLVVSVIIMFATSLATTKNIFDFSAFFNNISEISDMTINYFNLGSLNYLFFLKMLILCLLILSMFSLKKERFIQFIFILFLCIFNPFCCSFINKILIVYFRAFDIIVNPFAIVLYIDLLLGYLREKTIFRVVLCVIIIYISIQNNPTRPLYFHASLEPGYNEDASNYTNYNNEFKMSQDEKETIEALYEDVNYYNINNPYIVTPSLLTQGFITDGRYLYTRRINVDTYPSQSEKQLFAIFYPERWLGDHVEGINADYDNIKKYVNEVGVDYLVVDKTKEFFDEKNNIYSYLHLKVSESFYPMFENDRYIVYRCFDA